MICNCSKMSKSVTLLLLGALISAEALGVDFEQFNSKLAEVSDEAKGLLDDFGNQYGRKSVWRDPLPGKHHFLRCR